VVQSLEEDNNHFNGDGTVNTLDLRIAAIYFGQEEHSPYDLNFDKIFDTTFLIDLVKRDKGAQKRLKRWTQHGSLKLFR